MPRHASLKLLIVLGCAVIIGVSVMRPWSSSVVAVSEPTNAALDLPSLFEGSGSALFRVVRTELEDAEYMSFDALAKVGSDTVGIRVRLHKPWTPLGLNSGQVTESKTITRIQPLQNDFTGYVELRSLGDGSKKLGAAFSERYGIAIPNKGIDSVILEGVAFAKNPIDPATRQVDVFLEYNPPDEDRRTDFRCLIDFSAGTMEIIEPKPEHRRNLVKCLNGDRS
jgi:hypothetical protein